MVTIVRICLIFVVLVLGYQQLTHGHVHTGINKKNFNFITSVQFLTFDFQFPTLPREASLGL